MMSSPETENAGYFPIYTPNPRKFLHVMSPNEVEGDGVQKEQDGSFLIPSMWLKEERPALPI